MLKNNFYIIINVLIILQFYLSFFVPPITFALESSTTSVETLPRPNIYFGTRTKEANPILVSITIIL